MCHILLVRISNNNLYGVVFKALRLVDRDGIGNLKRDGCVTLFTVFIAVTRLKDIEPYGGVLDPNEIINLPGI